MNYRAKVNILWFIWTAAIIFLLFVLIREIRTPALRIILYLVIALAGYVLIRFIAALIAKKGIGKITALLFSQCDPDKFLSAAVAYLPAERPGKPPAYIRAALIYEGLYAQGRYEEALAELQKLTRFSNTRFGVYQKAAWQINLAEVSIALGQLDAAERALAACLDVLENREIAWKPQQVLYKGYHYEMCKLDIARGRYDGTEALLAERFDQAKNAYERVGAKYHLALLYRLTGEDEKGREAYQYVAEHGNRLHFAELAREQLGLKPQPSVARLWKQETVQVP